MELAKPAFPALPQAKEDSEVGGPAGVGGAPPAGSPRPPEGPRSRPARPRAALRKQTVPRMQTAAAAPRLQFF